MTKFESQFDVWRDWVKRGLRAIPQDHTGFVPGFYRTKMGDKPVGVAIWHDDDGLQFQRDGVSIDSDKKREEVYAFCSPCSKSDFDWLVSDHSTDPVYAKLPSSIGGMLDRVRHLACIPIIVDDEEGAGLQADIAHQLKQIENQATKDLKEAQAPLHKQMKEMKMAWDNVIQTAQAARSKRVVALTDYLKTKNEPKGVKGQLGKAVSLRTRTTFVIHDLEAALNCFLKSGHLADFESTVEKLVRAELRKGNDAVPGVDYGEERKAQ